MCRHLPPHADPLRPCLRHALPRPIPARLVGEELMACHMERQLQALLPGHLVLHCVLDDEGLPAHAGEGACLEIRNLVGWRCRRARAHRDLDL